MELANPEEQAIIIEKVLHAFNFIKTAVGESSEAPVAVLFLTPNNLFNTDITIFENEQPFQEFMESDIPRCEWKCLYTKSDEFLNRELSKKIGLTKSRMHTLPFFCGRNAG